ncbi:unnamed protein product [Symbiodinium necroappetens]|uniref:Uncharacterized protein n=1 Tax=Symbiodinium necroappetens TaxID=1628268 RepID=A0A812ZRF0_9DINO|nr:unnamed protein product [Symbiodinium necroappetens]
MVAFSPVVSAALSQDACDILIALGIDSDSDLSEYFADEFSLLEVSSDDRLLREITNAWRVARVQMRVQEQLHRAPALPSKRPADDLGQQPLLLGARPKARLFPPAALRSRSYTQAVSQAATPSLPPRHDRRAGCLQAMFQIAILCGSANLVFGADLVLQQDEARPLFDRKFQSLSDDRLVSHRAAMRRWVDWHSKHAPIDQPFWRPTAVTLSSFFQDISRNGPTAASGAFGALMWWRRHVGVPFPLQDALVSHWSAPTQGHTAQQREPLSLRIVLALCKAGASAQGAIRSFVCHALLALVACLRFRHLQRSHNLRLCYSFLRATCRKGKRRVQQTQPPFDWACPAILPFGLPLAEQVMLDNSEVKRALGRDPDFLVHDYEVPKGEPLTASSKRRLVAMSLPRFTDFLRAVLLGLGIPEADVKAFSSYSLRRFLPTAADILRLPEEHRLAIGNWQERPTATADRTQPRAVHHMAQHYANDKVFTSARIKQEVLVSIFMVARRVSFKLSWDDFRQNLPATDDVTQELRKSEWHPAAASIQQGEFRPGSESSDSASSSSGESSSSEDPDAVAWFQQSLKGACHLVQGMAGIRFVPFCQDLPFDAPHCARGSGIEPGIKMRHMDGYIVVVEFVDVAADGPAECSSA